MKYKSKIITCAFISFFMMFLLNNVIAVGNVYQAVYNYDTTTTNPNIIYRTIVKPHYTVLGSDDFANAAFNEWVTGNKTAEGFPTWSTYKSNDLIFTKQMIGKYDLKVGKIAERVGYSKFNYTIDDNISSGGLNENTSWIEEFKTKSEYKSGVYVSDVSNLYSYGVSNNLVVATEITLSNLSKYIDNIIDVNNSSKGITSILAANSNGSNQAEKHVMKLDPSIELPDVVPMVIEHKMLATNINDYLNSSPSKVYSDGNNEGKNNTTFNINSIADGVYYIMDIKLDEAILDSLRTYLTNNTTEEGNLPPIYVSGISSTCAKDKAKNDDLEKYNFYLLTPGAWVRAKNLSSVWGNPLVAGQNTNDEGLSSGLNLWDNQLYLPLDQQQNKTIYVRHIKVDVDNNDKSTNFEVIDTKKTETLTAANENSTEYYSVEKLCIDKDGKLTECNINNSTTLLNKKETLTSKATKYTITAPDSKTQYKVNALVTDSVDGYVCAGASVEVMASEAELSFISENDYIKNKYGKDGKDLYEEAKFNFNNNNNKNENTVAVVNMYYVQKSKTVKVSHKLCKDDDFKNCPQLLWFDYERYIKIKDPTDLTKTEWTTLGYNGSDYEQTYYINENYVVTAHGVVNHWAYDYKGYKLVDSGGTNNGVASECTSESKSDITIEFYYKEKEITVEEPGPKPEIDIPGTLTVKSAINVDATCDDFYSVPTDANSFIEKELFIGIKNTPRYVLGGINVEKPEEDIEKEVEINVKISFGPHTKTWQINVPYSLSYYAIQEILMYKYQNAKINNAGHYNTSGEPLFNSEYIYITPRNTSTLTFSSAANANIPITDLNDWKNYLSTKYKTNYMIPTDNPYDEKENSTDRIGIEYDLYGGGKYTASYEGVDNTVDKYIKFEQIKEYTEIALEGSATISINLFDEGIFNKIDKNLDDVIAQADLDKFKEITDEKADALKKAKEKYEDATVAYNDKCNENGYGNSCWDNVLADLNKYTAEASSQSYECSDSEGNPTTCYYSCATWGPCGDASQALENIRSKKDEYDKKKDAYDAALRDLKKAYEGEIFAIQNYDEAYYIQENIWKEYEKYNNADIAKLFGLDIKFDYSSGNVKLGEKELMTVEKESFELLSNSEKALSGSLVGDTCSVQPIKAKRQELTAEQKKNYTRGIEGASWLPNSRDAVTETYYYNNDVTIDLVRLNGKRVLAGEAYYVIDTENRVGSSAIVKDNMYYDLVKDGNKVIQKVFEVSSSSKFFKYYGVTQNEEVKEKQKTNADYNNKNPNSEEFNVYTPLVVSATVNQDITIIDQSSTGEYNKDNIDVIQANSTFTINFKNDRDKVYKTSGLYDFTSRYKQFTYIKFEFAVSNVKYVGAEGYERSYGSVEANKWIGPIYGERITVVPYLNTTQGESVTDQKYNYYVVAAAVNTSKSWTNLLLAYINTSLDDLENQSIIDTLTNPCGYEGKDKLSYYADTKGTLIIVNRMYDFRVTDLKDLDWKKVFRNNESYVNQHSGIAYYSGLNKWNTKNPTKYNEIIGRTSYEIGTSPSRVLPIGPYKNTDTSYIYAPKLGYRFSFDLKVTGTSNSDKYVKINPSFYYISKDGKTYYDEYKSSLGKEGIYLFYKNSSGKYIRVGASNDKYQIQFTPNDGYRSLVQTDARNLSSRVITLGSLTELKLKLQDTSTISANESSITYYGEYKLPNSIIAVRVNKNGTYDINKPLTDGYIGVVFNIQAIESSGVSLVYGKNAYNGKKNTSQWDYEGYLGISKPGEEYSTTLRLEKGTWKIDNAMYNKIKGTVILYDVDSKASNDFD